MKRNMLILAAVAVVGSLVVSPVHADTVTSLNGASTWGYVAGDDVKAGGSASIVATPTIDGDGSLKIMTDTSIAGSGNDKAYVGTGGSFGLLSQVSDVSFNYLVDAANTVPDFSAPAFKLFLNNGASLTWERAYNYADGATPASWQSEDMTKQVFWVRFGGTNYDIVTDMKDLSDWANAGSNALGISGLNFDPTTTSITGIQIGFGSGVTGSFTAYADDVNLDVGSSDYKADFAAVPLPASAWSGFALLGGLAAVGGVKRLRKQMA